MSDYKIYFHQHKGTQPESYYNPSLNRNQQLASHQLKLLQFPAALVRTGMPMNLENASK